VSLFAALDNDRYQPTELKPALAQWDNYQIYNLGCVDTWTERMSNGEILRDAIKLKTSFIAVQAYSIQPIACDFSAIMNTYT
jgi:hypothetical protein